MALHETGKTLKYYLMRATDDVAGLVDDLTDRGRVCISPNDFLYAVEPGIEHHLIWALRPLGDEVVTRRFFSSLRSSSRRIE